MSELGHEETLAPQQIQGSSTSYALNAAVDLAAQRAEVDRLCQKRLRAILKRTTLSLRIAVGIMMIGTSGRMAFALGRSLRPLNPGMLMSDRIKMRHSSPALVMR